MTKIIITAVFAILFGAILASSFHMGSGLSQPEPASITNTDGSLHKRLDYLENQVADEIKQRARLEKMLVHERELRMALADRVSELNGLDSALAGALENRTSSDRNNRFGSEIVDSNDQVTLLLEAGFSNYEAERIVELETEMQQSLINARFANDERVNTRELLLNSQKAMRQELGDQQYELYLETSGRPTSVQVSGVADDSPGSNAGIQTGDQILGYDGNRIFSILDLQEAAQTGTPGQTVIVDVIRDGSAVSLAIPRGEIGITTGGNNRGGRGN